MKEKLQEFKNKVENLQEVNVGDFRRRLSLYINRLEEEIPSGLERFIHSIRQETLYDHQEIEDIREGILQKIDSLDTDSALKK